MKKTSVLFFLMVCFRAVSSDFYFPAGASSAGVGHASVAMNDFWALVNNPAASVRSHGLQLGLRYESRFNFNPCSVKTLGAASHNEWGSVIASFQYLGYELYNQSNLALGYGRQFGDKVAAAVRIVGIGNRLSPFESFYYTFTADVSLLVQLAPKVDFGCYVFNVAASTLNNPGEEQIPVIYRTGLDWQLNNKTNLLVEMRGENGESPVLCGGVAYKLNEFILLEAGMSGKPINISSGIILSKWDFDLGLSCSFVSKVGKVWTCSGSYFF